MFVIRTDSHESLLFQLRKGLNMNKLIAALVAGLFAASAFAQTPASSSPDTSGAASDKSASASPTKPGKGDKSTKKTNSKKSKKAADASAAASASDSAAPAK